MYEFPEAVVPGAASPALEDGGENPATHGELREHHVENSDEGDPYPRDQGVGAEYGKVREVQTLPYSAPARPEETSSRETASRPWGERTERRRAR